MPAHLAPLPCDPALAGPYHLDAVLTPHRALSQRGFLAIMAIMVVFSVIFGVMFWSRGAWPVAGFLGLDAGSGSVPAILSAQRHANLARRAETELRVRELTALARLHASTMTLPQAP